MSKKTLLSIPLKHELETLYSQPGMSISKLARHYNTSNPTVRSWLNKYGIKRKAHKDICREVNKNKKSKMPPYQILFDAYSNNTIDELEIIFQCGQQTIYEWLNYYSIELKSLSDSIKKGKEKQFKNIQFTKEQILDEYNKTNHIALAAENLGISSSYFRTLKDRYNIRTNVPWRSKKEVELYEFVYQFDQDLVANDKRLLNPFELDIVSHKYKLAIEYGGLYWHSEYYGNKDRSYHSKKYKLCKEKGYTLLTVFETDDIEKVKKLIQFKLCSSSIGARKTQLVELNSKQANEFHNLYHMHGGLGGSYHYGLIYNDKLLMVASFHKSRFNKNFQYECGRLSSANIRVTGGVSKLFKHFMQTVDSSLITYADLRFGDGNCYSYCGMKRLADTPENYWYFSKSNPSQLFSRVKFQKHKLKDIFSSYDVNLTEYENMKNNGWDRIWDCGNAVYVSY
jgi:transposase